VRERIRAQGSPVAHLVDDLLGFFGETYLRVYGFPAPPVHDACAVARVIDPTLIRSQPMHVDVELRGEWTAGRTVCDRYNQTGKPSNAEVGLSLDASRFWDRLIGVLGSYGAGSAGTA
jgi:inosine-uridine nucleoside N-ribohydrolase